MRVLNRESSFSGGAAPRHRQRRAITLIAVVLVTALAASLVLVVLRQAVMTSRSESARADVSRAQTLVDEVQAEFERRLRDNPRFYEESMFEWERPRRCSNTTALPDSTDLGPGEGVIFHDADEKRMTSTFPWALPPTDPRNPSADITTTAVDPGRWADVCGAGGWDYLPAGQPLAGYSPQRVRVEIVPPTSASSEVTLKAVATHNSTEAAVVASYRTPAVSMFGVYSGTDLNLDNVYKTHEETALRMEGIVYANGRMQLPTEGAQVAKATLLAEHGFVGKSPGRMYSGVAEEVAAHTSISHIRTAFDRPQDMTELLANAGSLADAASKSEGRGGLVLNAQRVGAPVYGWLLLPRNNKIEVYARTSGPLNLVGNCAVTCDPYELARTSGESPGELSTFDIHVGALDFPENGLLWADADVFFSRCDGYLSTAANPVCGTATFGSGTDEAPADGGVQVEQSVTVVAGTNKTPRNIWISGPVQASEGTKVGLVATGQIKFPYWAHTKTGDLQVNAAMLALNLGAKPGEAAVTGFPERSSAPTGEGSALGSEQGYGGRLTIRGSIAAPAFHEPISGYLETTFANNPLFSVDSPPHFPGFVGQVVRQTSQRVSSGTVCGRSSCYGYW